MRIILNPKLSANQNFQHTLNVLYQNSRNKLIIERMGREVIEMDKVIEIIKIALKEFPITHLIMNDLEINANQITYFEAVSTAKSTLLSINLAKNKLGDEGVKKFIKWVLSRDTNIINCDLSDNNITDVGVVDLANFLTKSDIRRLCITDNEINTIDPLLLNNHLVILEAGRNKIKNITVVPNLSTLTTLNLADNPIIDINLEALKYFLDNEIIVDLSGRDLKQN